MSEKMTVADRLQCLFDEGVYTPLDPQGNSDVVTGFGRCAGTPCCAFAQTGEAMTKAQGDKIQRIFDLAMKIGAPVVGIYDSVGAQVDEGPAILNVYGELMLAANRLSGVVPQISVVTGVCSGCSALLAQTADLTVMTPDGRMFVTPPFTLGESEVFADAAHNVASGAVQISAESDAVALGAVRKALALLPSNNLSAAPHCDFSEPSVSTDWVESTVDAGSQLELYAGFAAAAKTCLCSVAGTPCGVAVASDVLNRDACVKLARFVRLCDAFSLPVITFVDTKGFESSVQAESTGAVREAALLAGAYGEATTAKICVVTGTAIGPVYATLAGRGANADCVLAAPTAVIAPLAAATAVSVLYEDRIAAGESRAALEAEYLQASSGVAAAACGAADDVTTVETVRGQLIALIEMLEGKRVPTIAKKHSNMPL